MDTNNVLQTQMTVEEVLTNWPDSRVVFMKQKTNCVGCFLQRFCTLQDVAGTYRIPVQELIGGLREHVQNNSQM
jgi:hybrid cluster-associated redox disulfide protein